MNPAELITEPRRPAWSRPEAVFFAAALTLLMAFLIPMPTTLLAILWVCTFCLAGAVTMICLLAGSSADLLGFVPLVSFVSLLRLAALAGAARRMIQHDAADPLLQSTGELLAGQWPLGAIVTCLLLAAVVSAVVFASTQRITLASTGYVQRVFPLKRIGIETDLRMSVIDQDQAKLLARRIRSEYRFFAGMQGTSLLMKAESAICVVVLLACVLLPILNGSVAGSPDTELLTQIGPALTGMTMFTMLPLVIVAASCGWMMGRDTLSLRSEHQNRNTPTAKKIHIVTREAGAAEEIEVLNPESLESSLDEQFVEFEPAAPQTGAAYAAVFKKELETLENAAETKASADAQTEFSCRSAEDYYDKLSRTVLSDSPVPRAVLLAAKSLQNLPVTVAVNMAIRLAQRQKRILLVDTDTTRNPLARVFELDPQTLSKKAIGTCFENLFVCTVPAVKLQGLLRQAGISRSFDMLLIYAPDCAGVNIEASADIGGFFFGDNQSDARPSPTGLNLKRVPPIHSVLQAAG